MKSILRGLEIIATLALLGVLSIASWPFARVMRPVEAERPKPTLH